MSRSNHSHSFKKNLFTPGYQHFQTNWALTPGTKYRYCCHNNRALRNIIHTPWAHRWVTIGVGDDAIEGAAAGGVTQLQLHSPGEGVRVHKNAGRGFQTDLYHVWWQSKIHNKTHGLRRKPFMQWQYERTHAQLHGSIWKTLKTWKQGFFGWSMVHDPASHPWTPFCQQTSYCHKKN